MSHLAVSRQRASSQDRFWTQHWVPFTDELSLDPFLATVEDKVLTEFRQPLQVQSHLEMPGILVQLGHIQRTWKLAPLIDLKWSPTWSLRRYQAICP